MNFQIGDRVETAIGDTGVIVGIDSLIAVRMDEFNDIYHICGGLCAPGHGRYFKERYLKGGSYGDLYEDVVI